MEKIKVYGIPEVIRELQMFDKAHVLEIRKGLRVAVEPMRSTIQSYIPDSPPLMGKHFTRGGGMSHTGRTGWNKAGVKVSIKTSFTKRAQRNESSLVSIVVGGRKGQRGGAALAIADMAGRRGKVKTGGRTKDYPYKGGTRSHAIRGQGRGMIENLQGSPSRYVWRGAMVHMITVQRSVMNSLDKIMKDVNQNLQVKK